MNPLIPCIPAFDRVFHVGNTDDKQLRAWLVSARELAPRRLRVFVFDEVSDGMSSGKRERLARTIHARPEFDWHLWSSRAGHFGFQWLGPIQRDLFKARRPGTEPGTLERWVIEWSAGRQWPEQVCLGLHCTDADSYRAQVMEHALGVDELRTPDAAWPRLWVAWPVVDDPAPDLGLRPALVADGWHNSKARQAGAAREARIRRRLVRWVVCGGPHAARLQIHCTGYHVPSWILRDAHNPEGGQWPPTNAEARTGNAEEEPAEEKATP